MSRVLALYRPRTLALLAGALAYERQEEQNRRYLGDIACLILRALAPDCGAPLYSQLAGASGGEEARALTGGQILSGVLARLDRMKEG